jgi:hypothetical protein
MEYLTMAAEDRFLLLPNVASFCHRPPILKSSSLLFYYWEFSGDFQGTFFVCIPSWERSVSYEGMNLQ